MTLSNQYINSIVWRIAISIILPALIEAAFYLIKNLRFKEEELPPAIYKMKVEDYIADWFMFFHLRKPIIVLVIISIVLAPSFGKYVANHKTKYETVIINNCDYVIVSTVGDNAYVEAYDISDGHAVIHTDEYMRISINDHTIRTIEFNEVEIA